MDNDTQKQLTVTLAGRPYPLKIKTADEAVLRRIVKEVNDKISRFRLAYPRRDMQDCIALATLAYAVDFHKARQQSPDSATAKKSIPSTDKAPQDVVNKLTDLNELLDDLL